MHNVVYTKVAHQDIENIISNGDVDLLTILSSWLEGLAFKGVSLGRPLTSADLTASGKFDYTGFYKIAFSYSGEDYRIIYRQNGNSIEVVKIGNRDVVYKSPPIPGDE